MAPQQDPVEQVVDHLRDDRLSNSDGLQRGIAEGQFVAEFVVPFFTEINLMSKSRAKSKRWGTYRV